MDEKKDIEKKIEDMKHDLHCIMIAIMIWFGWWILNTILSYLNVIL